MDMFLRWLCWCFVLSLLYLEENWIGCERELDHNNNISIFLLFSLHMQFNINISTFSKTLSQP